MPYALEPPDDFLQILQRIWWRLDRALDEAADPGVGARRGRWRRCLAGTTTLVDHHASPNAIDGSLDVIAEALGELGVRSVLCVRDDRPGRARRGQRPGSEENERFLGDRGATARRAGRSAPTPRSRSPTTRSPPASSSPSGPRSAVHIHVAEDDVGRDAMLARGSGPVSSERLADAGALDGRRSSPTASTSTTTRSELVRDAGASVAHNPRSNMNNSVGHAARRRLGDRVALGTDGIGADMFAESRAAYFRAREDDLADADRLAARARSPRAPGSPGAVRRAALGQHRARRAGRSRRPRLRGADAARTGATSPGTGSSGSAPATSATSWSPASWSCVDRRLTTRRPGGARGGRGRPGRRALGPPGRIGPRHAFAPRRGRGVTVTTDGRVALYLQDKHPIRDGMAYARSRRRSGFEAVWQAESRLVREATVPDGRVRRGHRADQDRLRRGQQLDAQRRAARGDVLHARRPRARAACCSGSARGGTRWRRRSASSGASRSRRCARPSRSRRRLLAMERVTFHGEFVHVDDIEIDIVHGDRSPKDVPIYIGATGMKMMELAGEIADGVVLNYLVGPALQRGGDGDDRARAPHGPAADARRHRPAAAGRLFARPRPRASRSTARASC